ncbi:MAG: hypothetical protein GF398_02020 [Chitinivibrionales bacterium]|nr:hypothetical protein [Chitinivibrionales bacterium]
MANPGYYAGDHTTYTITNMFPPRPWRNYLWNDRFIVCPDQFGFGGSWDIAPDGTKSFCAGGADNRIIYVRDNSSGAYWAANRNYQREQWDEFHCEVGLGYSRIVSLTNGIRTALRLFVPSQGLCECWIVEVENTADTDRNISVYPYMESHIPNLRIPACNSAEYVDAARGIVLSNHNRQNDIEFSSMYFAAESAPHAYETTNRRFRGVYAHNNAPDTLEGDGQLASANTSFDYSMMAALQYNVKLAPGEKRTLRFLAGLARNAAHAAEIVHDKLDARLYENELARLHDNGQKLLNCFRITTPDDDINAFANVWLKRQVKLGKTFGRVSGIRFRDVMEDVAAYLPQNPAEAKERIRYLLSKQFENGNTPRQWIPFDKSLYRDGSSWIAETVCQYIKETGDFDFLNESISYLHSDASGTVLEHIMRGHEFLFNELGEHGLCLWGSGDWNDSINAAGLQGKGESVWLSQALVASSREFTELLEKIDEHDKARYITKKADAVAQSILTHAWDSDHFICGFNDDGERIGTNESIGAQIFLICQAWAVHAQIALGDTGHALMDVVERRMKCPWGYMLSQPSYDNRRSDNPAIGRITMMEKGSYENGSVYNHGACFKIGADAKLGRGRHAYESVKMMLPSNPANPAETSGCEPYAITNMYLGPENPCRPGHSINPWTTGTAGWLLRCISEFMVGIIADYDGLAVRPVLNSAWKEIKVRREFRNAVYNITILNPKGLETGNLTVKMDGKPLDTNILPPVGDEEEHEVTVEVSLR